MRIIVNEDTYTIDTNFTMEELRKVARWEPKALTYVDQDGNVLYQIAPAEPGYDGMNSHSACFADTSRRFGNAILIRPLPVPAGTENDEAGVRRAIVEAVGNRIFMMQAIEGQIRSALERIEQNERDIDNFIVYPVI